MRDILTVREHEKLALGPKLTREDVADLEAVARRALKHRDGDLAASKHVGIVTTRRGVVVEILPKIDLGGESDPDHERTRQVFLRMLRCSRRLPVELPESGIRAMRRFPMLEIFVRQFLLNLGTLVRAGLARRYVPVEESLPFLRGRILFREQLRRNVADQTRFHVVHDELSVDRPANRLIHSALSRLAPGVRSGENRQLLRELKAAFADIPQATDLHADWRAHHVDRSMRHYRPVMQWVGLFLFERGLATFSGRNVNLSLLFDMEQVFQDFVTRSFRRFQNRYEVAVESPQRYLTTKNREDGKNDEDAFRMEPDISLKEGERVVFVLDAKWKEISAGSGAPKHGIDQRDMYQLYAYGKRYGCRAVALVYPQTDAFKTELHYRFFDGLPLICLPFDVAHPEGPKDSVRRSIQSLSRVCRSRE
ncbi:MAG: hypothetical protein OXI15_21455 [Chromatiales bacterium]|nr:hypothetical protein [Chromatiales bacterium]